MRRLIFGLAALTCLWAAPGRPAAAAEPDRAVHFNRDIRPILSENCFQCHGPDENVREAELRLDTRDGLYGELASGGTAIVPGKPGQSTLYGRVTSEDASLRMPPETTGKRLTAEELGLIRRWIEAGAEWQGHWSFIPPRRPPVPQVEDEARVRNPVDAFILSRLEEEGLHPSPEADRITLARRLSFDLTGLPPTPDQVDAFLDNDSPRAYEEFVESLLESPHYGERMAVYWLDLVRYADSGGYHSDNTVHISPYRDYVIHAFNDNLPFDRFTREQLAGDLLPDPTIEQIVASGYNRLNKTTEEGGAQPEEYLAKYAADRIRTTAGAWLGATLGCAECHDHKYDPYTMRDFYSFGAFFADVKEQGKYGGNGKRDPEMMVPNRTQAARLDEIDRRLAEWNEALAGADSAEEDSARVKKQIEAKIAELTAEKERIKKNFTRTMITVSVKPRTMRILPRGNWLDKSGPVVTPAVPEFLPHEEIEGRRLTRLDLADWLTSRENPLTARVFVNRLWKLFFGTGISKRLDDLGAQGEWPTHPELLDWLAVEFMDSGWDVKHIVRLLVTSNTYRQSSHETDRLHRIDPDNRLYARQSRWRLEAEFIRDNALATSGLLVRKIGGPSVKPYQPAGYWSHLNFPQRSWKHDTGADQYRRGLYTHWQRTFLHPSLLAFDAPTREECTAERPVSNTPKAALTLLNDPTFVEAARVFAVRILREGGSDPAERIHWAWRQALSRPPEAREVQLLAKLLDANLAHYRDQPEAAKKVLTTGLAPPPQDFEAAEVAAWTAVARALLNLNETITRN